MRGIASHQHAASPRSLQLPPRHTGVTHPSDPLLLAACPPSQPLAPHTLHRTAPASAHRMPSIHSMTSTLGPERSVRTQGIFTRASPAKLAPKSCRLRPSCGQGGRQGAAAHTYSRGVRAQEDTSSPDFCSRCAPKQFSKMWCSLRAAQLPTQHTHTPSTAPAHSPAPPAASRQTRRQSTLRCSPGGAATCGTNGVVRGAVEQ